MMSWPALVWPRGRRLITWRREERPNESLFFQKWRVILKIQIDWVKQAVNMTTYGFSRELTPRRKIDTPVSEVELKWFQRQRHSTLLQTFLFIFSSCTTSVPDQDILVSSCWVSWQVGYRPESWQVSPGVTILLLRTETGLGTLEHSWPALTCDVVSLRLLHSFHLHNTRREITAQSNPELTGDVSINDRDSNDCSCFRGRGRFRRCRTSTARCPGAPASVPGLGWRRSSSAMMTTGRLSPSPSTTGGRSTWWSY